MINLTVRAFDLRINKLIRHYFKLQFKHKLIHKRYYTRRKRLLFLNKIYTSKAEIKHTNTKAVATVYIYNREKSVLINKIRKMKIKIKYKKKIKHIKISYLRKCLTKLYIKRASLVRAEGLHVFNVNPKAPAYPAAAKAPAGCQGLLACAQKLPNHIFKSIDLSYLLYLYGSQSEGIQQKLTGGADKLK